VRSNLSKYKIWENISAKQKTGWNFQPVFLDL